MMTGKDKYAEVLLHNAVGLQKGQKLHITAPAEERDFIEILVRHAYQNGAGYVDTELYDPIIDGIRAEESDREYLSEYPSYLVNEKIDMLNEKTAQIRFGAGILPKVSADNDRLAEIKSGVNLAMKPFNQMSKGKNLINHCSSILPTRYWASQIFPEMNEEDAYSKLWDCLLEIGKTDEANPVEEWNIHVDNILKRRGILNERQFKSLHIKNSRSDFTVELCPDHFWEGGCEFSVDHVASMPNFPTEEIFCTMQKTGIEGYVHSSRPFVYENNIIDDFELVFEKGRIIKAEAAVGQEYLDQLLNTEEGTRYCGEIALLAGETIISRTNTIFKNTLLDENAACHMAIGCAYMSNLKTPIRNCREDYEKMNINYASVHYDFMFGTADTDVTAIDAAGNRIPLLSKGSWCI